MAIETPDYTKTGERKRTFKPHKNPNGKVDYDEAIRLFTQGWSVQDLAKKYRVEKNNLKRGLWRRGIATYRPHTNENKLITQDIALYTSGSQNIAIVYKREEDHWRCVGHMKFNDFMKMVLEHVTPIPEDEQFALLF